MVGKQGDNILIYFIRTLKTGERYITGYKDQAMAKRIASQESTSSAKKLWDGELFFDLKSGKYGADASGVGLVTHIKSEAGPVAQEGRFAVFALADGKPVDLGLRFKQYGEANKFVRAVINSYEELFVLEMEKMGSGSQKMDMDDDSVELSEEAPF
jgi:hypothetical protein